MFKFLTPTPDAVKPNTAKSSSAMPSTAIKSTTQSCQTSPRLWAALLTGALLFSGCQQQSDSNESDHEQIIAQEDKAAIQSDSAAARIAQFQPLYIAQMQALQQRLQAEYQALQVADNHHTETSLKTDPKHQDAMAENVKDEINTSTQVGERDLEVLKRISLEPQKSELLTEAQIIERYQQAMQALYEPTSVALNSQEIDTLMNINTLLPQLFEHPEIAQRISVKSPALARLIVQHQVGQQIQAQQALDMQQMKLSQQQEFETLMLKFNDTIEDYDKQIAKYEQTLTEFQE